MSISYEDGINGKMANFRALECISEGEDLIWKPKLIKINSVFLI